MLNRPLYEIESELQRFLDEPGELTDEEFSAKLDALMEERGEKLDRCWYMVHALRAERDMLKEHAKNITERARVADSAVDRLEGYIARCLGEGNKYKSQNSPACFSWRKSEAVEITNENIIPDAYCEFKRVPVLSEIKRDIKGGAEVPGVTVITRQNLQVR